MSVGFLCILRSCLLCNWYRENYCCKNLYGKLSLYPCFLVKRQMLSSASEFANDVLQVVSSLANKILSLSNVSVEIEIRVSTIYWSDTYISLNRSWLFHKNSQNRNVVIKQKNRMCLLKWQSHRVSVLFIYWCCQYFYMIHSF